MEFIQSDNFVKAGILLFFFFLFSSLLKADSPTDPFDLWKENSSRVVINTGYSFASDAITNRIAKTYFLAGFISPEMKNDVSSQAYPVNRFGADAGYSLLYEKKCKTFFGKTGFSWNVSLADQNHLHSLFTKDAFEIYFKGNAAYSGKLAELGKFDLSLLHYQQLTLGLSRESIRKNYSIRWEAGLSFNKGQKFQSIHSNKANLFTSADGEYLDLDFDIQLRGSDSAKSDLGAMNGTGGSVQLAVSIKDEEENEFAVSIRNLGFIQFNNQSYLIPADSIFRFEGIDATPLFHFSDTIKTDISSDSAYVQSFLSGRKKESYTYQLPAQFQISYYRKLGECNGIQIGLDQVFYSSYLPHGWCNLEHRIHNRHKLGLMLGYGGYTVWQAGLSYQVKFAKTWLFQIQSSSLSGWLNTKKGRAQGAFVSLSKYL
ncbi:MAG: DUF5723 family protein [Bacteroidia bacterium]